MKKLMLVIAACLLFVGITVGMSGSANATTWPEVCAQNGAGLCVNAWSGGPAVSTFPRGAQNNAFHEDLIDPCNSGGRVTHTCPFTLGSGMNDQMFGYLTIRLHDLNSGLCVGTTSGGSGWEGGCGNANASGAANGVIMVRDPSGQGGFWLIDRYWSNYFGHLEAITNAGQGNYLDMYYGSIASASSWSVVDVV